MRYALPYHVLQLVARGDNCALYATHKVAEGSNTKKAGIPARRLPHSSTFCVLYECHYPSISQPRKCRSAASAALRTLYPPAEGSTITSPLLVTARISRCCSRGGLE